MKRGPKATPHTILKLRGSHSPNAVLRDDEPAQFEDVKTLEPFIELNTEERRVWDYTTAYMAKMKILGQVSVEMLTRYVRLQAKCNQVKSNSRTALSTWLRISPVLTRLEAALGLTPADRRAVSAGKGGGKVDPLAALMMGGSD